MKMARPDMRNIPEVEPVRTMGKTMRYQSLKNGEENRLNVSSVETTKVVSRWPSTEANLDIRLLLWTAVDEETLRQMTKDAKQYLQKYTAQRLGYALNNISYTLSSRRSRFPWRSFTIVDPKSNPFERSIDVSPPHRVLKAEGTAFVFTGQGAQYPGMGRELVCYRVFSDTLQQLDKVLHAQRCQWSIIGENPSSRTKVIIPKYTLRNDHERCETIHTQPS